jgi:hypothetical protein
MKWRTLLKTVAKDGVFCSWGAMEAAKKVVLEPLASALGVAAFLHNVIIVHCKNQKTIYASLCTIMPHYVKKLGEKNYWRKLRSVRVFHLYQ